MLRVLTGGLRRDLLSSAGRCLASAVLLLSLCVHATPVGGVGAQRSQAAGQVLYQPADASQFAGYPRVIRLAHNGPANGTLLATFDIFVDGHDSILVYSSGNDGRAWLHRSTLNDPAYGGRMCCATLFELPRRLDAQPAGTVLLAESAGAAGTIGHVIKIFASRDQGRTWVYLSACAQGDGGLWEPDFQIDRAGRLVCYFSDERQVEYSQFLGHVVSSDGGRTWGLERMDVAVPDGISRPGMATVVRLPGGPYVMSFEVCGRTNCEVHVKTSPDGDIWGATSDLGPRVQTANGRYAGHTPYLSWVPAGGPRGTLVLAAQDLFGSDDLIAPESRQVLLVNRQAGAGPWSLVPAPLQVPRGGPLCANYSSALLPFPEGTRLLMVAAVGLAGGGCAIHDANAPLAA
jgi:hypothetical protein